MLGASARGALKSSRARRQSALLNRMRDFNDWAQCMLLEVVSRHEPKDQSELIDIMNLLETRLRSTNCGVILAITKVFLHLTVEIPKLHKQVFTRLRAPIITHMVSAGPELAFSCLQHIFLLVNRNPEVFIPEFKRFVGYYRLVQTPPDRLMGGCALTPALSGE